VNVSAGWYEWLERAATGRFRTFWGILMISTTFTGPFCKSCRFLQSRAPKLKHRRYLDLKNWIRRFHSHCFASLLSFLSLEELPSERVAFPPESSNLMYGMYYEACIAHLRFPLAHRRSIRTTNLLERLFGEERRRTKVIPHAFGERAVLKLMYAARPNAGAACA